jgi:hypothetical protein
MFDSPALDILCKDEQSKLASEFFSMDLESFSPVLEKLHQFENEGLLDIKEE